MEFEPGEVLIQVCHFSGVVQSTFGIPFLLKLKNQEQIVDVRQRIQKTLEISDKVFFIYFQTFKKYTVLGLCKMENGAGSE